MAKPDVEVILLGLLGELSQGWRSYPRNYTTALKLVDLGLAQFVEPPTEGEPYWLEITAAGRALIAQEATDA